MKGRFFRLWFILASAAFVATMLIDVFTTGRAMPRLQTSVILLVVTALQAAVLRSRRISGSTSS